MKKRAITSVCGLVLILAVLLTFVCVFTIYRDPINEAVLNTLNDIGIDAPESASVAEAAGSLSVSLLLMAGPPFKIRLVDGDSDGMTFEISNSSGIELNVRSSVTTTLLEVSSCWFIDCLLTI